MSSYKGRTSVEPTAEQIGRLTAVEEDGPIVMVNLLRYRDKAAYGAEVSAEPCTGREAYARYSEIALSRVATVGGRIVWAGAALSMVIGPEGEQWDDVALVEYPSVAAFVEMVSDPIYQACTFHRTAALEDSRLIRTTGMELPA